MRDFTPQEAKYETLGDLFRNIKKENALKAQSAEENKSFGGFTTASKIYKEECEDKETMSKQQKSVKPNNKTIKGQSLIGSYFQKKSTLKEGETNVEETLENVFCKEEMEKKRNGEIQNEKDTQSKQEESKQIENGSNGTENENKEMENQSKEDLKKKETEDTLRELDELNMSWSRYQKQRSLSESSEAIFSEVEKQCSRLFGEGSPFDEMKLDETKLKSKFEEINFQKRKQEDKVAWEDPKNKFGKREAIKEEKTDHKHKRRKQDGPPNKNKGSNKGKMECLFGSDDDFETPPSPIKINRSISSSDELKLKIDEILNSESNRKISSLSENSSGDNKRRKSLEARIAEETRKTDEDSKRNKDKSSLEKRKSQNLMKKSDDLMTKSNDLIMKSKDLLAKSKGENAKSRSRVTKSQIAKSNEDEQTKSAKKEKDDKKIILPEGDSKSKLNKAEIGTLVVKYLTPAYNSNRFESRDLFKSTARNITHKLVNRDKEDIKVYVRNFLKKNETIKSTTLF